ncbi:hypothetical protein SELMODRAFT_83081, partial [Selaginella moellendorffii]
TSLENIVFGIGASSRTWEHRKRYIKLWWRPNETRGIVSLDRRALTSNQGEGHDHIRITRLPSELFQLNFSRVHWFVLSDDDTFFVLDNLVQVLSRYDHREFYYIGGLSESHHQSVLGFSTSMAFGGAGIAMSYALVEALEKIQDDWIIRNYHIWGVDGKLQACMAELGVPLTIEKGFHQMDLHGDVISFLASHPHSPLVSLHHMDGFNPIFPGMSRKEALDHLSSAIQSNPSAVLQQSFCYNQEFRWSLKVA